MYAIDWLGPFELRKGGQALPLAVRKGQALLMLLAREGALPRERIVALLWPLLDESSARRNLRRELARLREAGAAGLVQADGDRLAIGAAVEVTAQRFQAAVDAGQPEAALALWRGPPADGLQLDDAEPWQEWLAQERRGLQALQAQALAQSAAGHEAAGAWAAALARVRVLLAADPLQERHHLHAMHLLDRLGQREAALAQYEDCVRLLAEELGLQPMAATREFAATLRAPPGAPQSQSPDTAPVAPADLVPATLPFVGRQQEVVWLEQAWRSGEALLIEGEGGVGKTRLVSDFCAAHGPYALVSCRSGDAELPLASFTRSLRALAGPAPELGGLPGWVRDELARLMPELGAAPRPLQSHDERLRFGHACALAWQHWAEGAFDAIVLDDWHLADAGSQALWLQVNGECDPPQRLVLVYRPTLTPAATELLAKQGQAGAARLRLEPLAPDAVYELVQRLSRRPEPRRFSALLARATDGNPFYMAETLRHLVERGLLTAAADGGWRTPFDDSTAGYEELPLPDSVRSAVTARVQRLPERARRVLQAAALADEPFDAWLLAPACALSEVEAALALEDALQARLLRDIDGGGLGFAHQLVQQSLEATLDNARRRSVHRRLALGAIAAGAPPARIAAHHEAGGEPRRAAPWRCRAAEQAKRLLALHEAVAQWRLALADGLPAGDEMAVRTAMLAALLELDRDDEAGLEADEVLRQVRSGSGTGRQCQEALIGLAKASVRLNRGEQAMALLDQLPVALEPAVHALALSARSAALRELGRVDEARELNRVALAQPDLDEDTRFLLLDTLALTELYGGHPQHALELAGQALEIARRSGSTLRVVRAQGLRGALLVQVGDAAGAESALLEAASQAALLRLVSHQRSVLGNLCVLYSAQSRPDAVLAAAAECWQLRPPMGLHTQRTMTRLAFVEAHQALGQLGQAHHWALGAVADARQIGQVFDAASVVMTTAELFAVLGEHERLAPLVGLLEAPHADQSAGALTETWLVRVECALMEGRLEAARETWRRVGTAAPLELQRVGVRAVIVGAAMRLAAGEPQAAIAGLPPDDTAGMNDELRWRALAVRLRAEAAGGGCVASTLDAAEAALQRPGVHALAALLLHQALLQAASTPSRRLSWRQRIESLASTLADAPELCRRFEQRWLGPA